MAQTRLDRNLTGETAPSRRDPSCHLLLAFYDEPIAKSLALHQVAHTLARRIGHHAVRADRNVRIEELHVDAGSLAMQACDYEGNVESIIVVADRHIEMQA